MKKLLCLFLVLILAMSVMVGCKKNNDDTPKIENDVVTTDNSTENEEIKDEEVPVSSDVPSKEDTVKKTPSKKDTTSKPAADVKPSGNELSDPYLISNASTNEESITYHLQNCPILKDKEIQKVTWEMIETLGFRHCSKCNPPKYNGYVE